MTLMPYQFFRTLLPLFAPLFFSLLFFQPWPQPTAASGTHFSPAVLELTTVFQPTHPEARRLSNLARSFQNNQIRLPGGVTIEKKKQANASKILATIEKVGPLFPTSFSMNNFRVEGLVKGRWPIFVEYELEADSTCQITISVSANKGKPEVFPIQLAPTNGRRGEVKAYLPEAFGKDPQLGSISFKAFKNGPEPRKPAQFFLYGLGVGDKAVGSSVLVQLKFQPGSIRPKLNQKASYSFQSLSDFNKMAVDFSLAVREPDGSSHPQLAFSKEWNNGVRRGQTVEGDWDGKNSKGKISVGEHQFHVRAWTGLKRGGDWAFAADRKLVRVEE